MLGDTAIAVHPNDARYKVSHLLLAHSFVSWFKPQKSFSTKHRGVKWILILSIFLAITPTLLSCQVFRKRKKNSLSYVYDLYKTLPHILSLSHRNVPKSVMHVQSCCFTHRICLSLPSKSLSPPWSSCLLKVPLSPLDGVVTKTSSNNNKTINWELPYFATQARLPIG